LENPLLGSDSFDIAQDRLETRNYTPKVLIAEIW